jgi:hypothetical protein
MSHFAQIDENNIVTQVIVAEQDFIDSGAVGDPSKWIQTSYNTSGGAHKLGGTPLRKNYAGIGYTYDAGRDAFIPPKTYSKWVLDEETCFWKAPFEHDPDVLPTTESEGVVHAWDDENNRWVAQPIPKLSA